MVKDTVWPQATVITFLTFLPSGSMCSLKFLLEAAMLPPTSVDSATLRLTGLSALLAVVRYDSTPVVYAFLLLSSGRAELPVWTMLMPPAVLSASVMKPLSKVLVSVTFE